MNLQRLLVNRIEHRILVGTVAFLATLVLVGWIAINEGGRMAAFDRQFTARAIERGAAIYAVTCSPCHGTDGLGTSRAPALNSPLLFGYDYLADIHREREALTTERGLTATTDARKNEIDARLAELDQEESQQSQQLQTAITKGYNPDAFSRLLNVGWAGSLHNYVYTTIFSGRPNSASYWPQPMPAWSQTAGGPLRNDQVEDLTQYILNFDKGDGWTVDNLNAIQQFPKTPPDPAIVEQMQQQIDLLQQSGGVLPDYVGVDTPIADIMTGLQGITGDPQRGSQLYNGLGTPTLPCSGCHLNAAVAPQLEGTWTRVENDRLKEPGLAGYTGEQYIAESIIHPSAHIAPNYTDNLMPKNFGQILTYQDLADLIAFLKTQDQGS
ncbi:MAG: cytochrome c [Anaerolineae bacterium]